MVSKKFQHRDSRHKGSQTEKVPARKVSPKVEETPKVVDEEVLEWIIRNAGLSELAKDFLFQERKYSEDVVKAMKIGSISDATKFVAVLTKVFSKERCIKQES